MKWRLNSSIQSTGSISYVGYTQILKQNKEGMKCEGLFDPMNRPCGFRLKLEAEGPWFDFANFEDN